jgi:hypothetical protein
LGFVQGLTTAKRLWYHKREIRRSLRHYTERTGKDADVRQPFADSGSFRSQLDRLFELGSAAETAELEAVAARSVTLCITNKFYRPADFLSDIIDALEGQTLLSYEPDGEPPLPELDAHERQAKLKQVMDSWLVPLKVASIESLLESFSRILGRSLPYKALGSFERQTAQLFSFLEESELDFAEEHLTEFLRGWNERPGVRERFVEPADGPRDIVQCLAGATRPEGTSSLRVRRSDQPLRLSTLVPEDRQHFLAAAFARLSHPHKGGEPK